MDHSEVVGRLVYSTLSIYELGNCQYQGTFTTLEWHVKDMVGRIEWYSEFVTTQHVGQLVPMAS